MTKPPASLPDLLPREGEIVSVRSSNGSGVQSDVPAAWFLTWASRSYVVAVMSGNGKRFRYWSLTVPPDVAFAAVGEHGTKGDRQERKTGKKQPERRGSALRTDASVTTVKQHLHDLFPCVVVGHHPQHCSGFGGERTKKHGVVKSQYV